MNNRQPETISTFINELLQDINDDNFTDHLNRLKIMVSDLIEALTPVQKIYYPNPSKVTEVDEINGDLYVLMDNLSRQSFLIQPNSFDRVKTLLTNALSINNAFDSNPKMLSNFITFFKNKRVTLLIDELFLDLSKVDFSTADNVTKFNKIAVIIMTGLYTIPAESESGHPLCKIFSLTVRGLARELPEKKWSFDDLKIELIKSLSSDEKNILNTDEKIWLAVKKSVLNTLKDRDKAFIEDLLRGHLPSPDSPLDYFVQHNKSQLIGIITGLAAALKNSPPPLYSQQTIDKINSDFLGLKTQLQNSKYKTTFQSFSECLEKILLSSENQYKNIFLLSTFDQSVNEVFNALQNKNEKPLPADVILTSHGEVKKATHPYLDARINPEDLCFDDKSSEYFLINKNYTEIKYNRKTFRKYKTIGKGAFGSVSLAQEPVTKQWMPIKTVNQLDPEDEEFHSYADFLRQQRILKQAMQDEITMLQTRDQLVFADQAQQSTGMKLAKGKELSFFQAASGSLPAALLVAKNILQEVAKLHIDDLYLTGKHDEQIEILHRDFKNSNFSLDAGTYKVQSFDFGISLFADKKKSDPHHAGIQVEWYYSGTLSCMAPEHYKIYLSSKDANKNAKFTFTAYTELYAIGVMLAHYFGMCVPDPNDENRIVMGKLKSIQGIVKEKIENDYTDEEQNKILQIVTEIYTLISCMIHELPDQRSDVLRLHNRLDKLFERSGKVCKPSVLVLSIADFLKFSNDHRFSLYQQIENEKFDGIVLRKSNDTTLKDYYYVRNLLSNVEINQVAPFTVQAEQEAAVLFAAQEHYKGILGAVCVRTFVYQDGCMVEKTRDIAQVKISHSPREKMPSTTQGIEPNVTTVNSNTLFAGLTLDEVKFLSGVLKVDHMLSFKMHINPDPQIKKSLIDREHKMTNKSDGSLDDSEDFLKEIEEQKSAEDDKLKQYKQDEAVFIALLQDFLNHLPSEPDQAARLLHYCSLKFFGECRTLQDVLPHRETSYHQQRCVLLQNVLYEFVKNKIEKNSDQFKEAAYWISILNYILPSRDVLILQGIYLSLNSLQSKSSLSPEMNTLLNTITPSNDLQKVLDGKVAETEKFNPFPPLISYFNIKYKTTIGGKLEVSKMVHFALTATIENITSKKLSLENCSELLVVLNQHKISGSWGQYIEQHCGSVRNDLEKRLQSTKSEVDQIIQTCLEAFNNVSLKNLEQDEIKKNGGMFIVLVRSCETFTNEIHSLEKQCAEMETSIQSFQVISIKIANQLVKTIHPHLDNLHPVLIQLLYALVDCLFPEQNQFNADELGKGLNRLMDALEQCVKDSALDEKDKNEIEELIEDLADFNDDLTQQGQFSTSTNPFDEFKAKLEKMLSVLVEKNRYLSLLEAVVDLVSKQDNSQREQAALLPNTTSSQAPSVNTVNSAAMFQPTQNQNVEFLALMKKIVMSKFWEGKSSKVIVGSEKPDIIIKIRPVFSKKISNDAMVVEINILIKKEAEIVKKNRKPDVSAFLKSVDTKTNEKVARSIERLENFVRETEDEAFIAECGVRQKEPRLG